MKTLSATMNRVFTFVLALTLMTSSLTPLSAQAATNACDNLCGVNISNAKNLINDAKCKNSSSCVSCVVKAVTDSQSGAYCTAYNDTKKGTGLQKVTATLNLASAATCATACAMSFVTVGGAGSAAWNRVCSYTGLANTAVEVGMTIANLAKGDSDLMGLATSALSTYQSVNSGIKTLGTKGIIEQTVKNSTAKTSKYAAKNLKNPACLNAVMFGITSASKLKSISDLNKTNNKSCDSAKALTSQVENNVQSCLLSVNTTPAVNNVGAGFFAATANVFTTPAVSDIDKYAASAGTDKYLRDAKADMNYAIDQGKVDMADIAKKVDAGESASSILAGAGMPSDLTDMVKDAEGRLNKGETSPLLASITGTGGYVGGEGAVANHGGAGIDEMAFGGSEATPGESNTVMEIERAPASTTASLAMANDGDVFHASFGGTIFDIVSGRIKEQKGQYAELEPEGRMNRVFNGYSDPKSKKSAK